MSKASTLDSLCINTIRTLAIDAIDKANSGHPGLPLGAAPMAYVLWQRHLAHQPQDPAWPNRDRFVLSAGHGSMLQYALLHLYGYDLPLEELRNFRQLGSRTPGHPEFGHTPGIEATTGPLGQGAANAVGMAIAECHLAARFNRPGHSVVDHRTYALLGDGDMMEGISAEAVSLAGHLGLGKLTFLYDSNDISLDGPLALSFAEDVAARFESCGWQVLEVADGDHDLDAIDAALVRARKETSKPTLVIVKTTIGFGSPNKAGSADSHGAPLGAEETAATKRALDWSAEGAFQVPDDARQHFMASLEPHRSSAEQWRGDFERWSKEHAALAEEWRLSQSNLLPEGWDSSPPAFETGSKLATRVAGGKTLNAFAESIPWLLGGDADLSCSTKTGLNGLGDFTAATPSGRNIRYGVREHAMGAIANGIAYHGGLRTFTGTFFVFSDYMRPAMRLAAMNRLPVTFIFTHDSVAVGEDGPTHQPVEHLMSLRAMPGLLVLRPCDALETVEAWRVALEQGDRPTVMVLSRQNLPTLDRTSHAPADQLRRGGYVLSDPDGLSPRAIAIATGAEVHVALQAQKDLASQGIGLRVVSMPSWELFEEQGADWKEQVLPAAIEARISIEAGSTFGWERHIGSRGIAIGMQSFGASGPGDELLDHFGFNAANAVRTVRTLLGSEVLQS